MRSNHSESKNPLPRHALLPLLLAAMAWAANIQAASGTWNGTTDGVWATDGNWSATPVPGTGDTATFNNAGNGNKVLDLGGGVTVTTIFFDTASAADYTIGSGAVGSQTLTLNDTAQVWMSSPVANNELINANVVLGTAITGTTTFTNAAAGKILTFAGTVQGGTGGTAGAKTVNNTVSGGCSNIFGGAVTAGGGTALNLINNGAGYLVLNGSATSTLGTLRATAAGTVRVDGQTVTVASSSQYGGSSAYGKFILQSGGAAFNGGIQSGTSSGVMAGADGMAFIVNGGIFSASYVGLGRSYNFSTTGGATTTAAVNMGTSGFQVNGGTANVTGAVDLRASNSSANGQVSGTGALTIGGELVVGGSGSASLNTTRTTLFQVTGGTLTDTDTIGGGIVLGKGTGQAASGELLLTGGTATTEKISFGVNAGLAGSLGNLTLNGAGAALYVGSGGIVLAANNAYTYAINLMSGTLGAKANWSSSMNMALAGSGMTIKAADASGVAKNITLSGVLSGVNGFIKTGGGTLTLAGTNTYTGNTLISAGTVQVGNGGTAGNLGAADAAGITNNGTLAFNRSDDITYSGNISGTGGLSQLGSGTLNVTAANTYFGDITVSSGKLILPATASVLSTNITLANGGTFDLSALSFTLAGGHALLGSGTITGDVSAASSALIVPGTLGTAGTLSFSNNLVLNSVTNHFDLSATTNGANDQINVAGQLTLNGVSAIVANFTAIPGIGRYRLFNYTGKAGTAAANLTLTLTGSSIGTLVAALDDSQGGIDLVLSSSHVSAAIVWQGDGSANNWDTSSINWLNTALSVMTNFYDYDSVTFNDTGSVSPAVNLTTVLSPTSTTVDAANNYTFGGPGQIAYGTLTKSNTGTLTILTTNTLTGGVAIEGGVLQIGDGVAAGTIGSGVVVNNASLIVNSPAPVVTGPINGTGNLSVSLGSLTIGGNSTLNGVTLGGSSTAGVLDLNGSIASVSSLALGSGATGGNIGNSSTNTAAVLNYVGADSSYAGVIQNTLGSGDQTLALRVNGTGTLTLSSVNPYSGGTVIGGGALAIGTGGTGQVGSGSVTITNGATLIMCRGDTTDNSDSTIGFNNPLVVSAGQTGTIWASPRSRTGSSGSASTFTSSLSGSGTLTLRVNATAGYFGGDWNAFTGQVNVTARVGNDDLAIARGGPTDNSFANLKLHLATGVNMVQSVNPPTGSGTETRHNIGELSGDSGSYLQGNPVSGRFATWAVGGLNTSSTFAGSLMDSTGAARLIKVGSGNLTLANDNAHTGYTLVNGGTLTVVGSIWYSPLTNYSGTTLAGVGSVASASLEVGSTISPGTNSCGTLTCAGEMSFNGATNLVDISTTNSDLIVVGGNLNLASGVVQLVIGDTLTNGTYRLISYSGALNGVTANLTLSGFSQPGQSARLVNNPGGIDLVVESPIGANLVWAGAAAADNLWNVASSLNWSNGVGLDVFHTGDHVTFDDSNPGNTSINLTEILQPVSTVVTGAQAYVFGSTSGAGRISGATNSLTVMGTGSLQINTVNDFGGPTTIGNGYTLTVGNGANAATLGAGGITNNGTLIFNQTNNLTLAEVTGAGSLTKSGSNTLTLSAVYDYTGPTTIGAGTTLQVGTNGATGPLLGAVTNNGTLNMNQSGELTMNSGITGTGTFIKSGTSAMTLGGVNSYQGNTYINNGTLKLGASEVIPDAVTTPGSVGWLILDGGATTAGTLDLNGFDESVNLLIGATGTVLGRITNSTAAGTNTLTFGNDFGSPSTTYNGLVTENLAGGKIALVKRGASTNVLTAANSYSGGTIIAGGTLRLANSTALGSGLVTLSNNATFAIGPDGGGNSIFVGNNVFTAAGATVTNTSSFLSSTLSGLFTSGDGNSTNVITGNVSIAAGATKQFQSFTGTVLVAASSQLRFSSSTLSVNGGDNTTFVVEGYINTRNGTGNAANSGVSLGALFGSGALEGAGNADGNGVYTIGAKGIDSTFSGVIRDSANRTLSIVKVGAAKLTLIGTVTNTGSMTVNDGTLALVEPVSLDNSATLKLGASTATIDVSGRTDGTLNLGGVKAQTLSGIGNVTGNLAVAANSAVSVGLGDLNVTGTATLNGPVTLQLNRTNAVTHSEIIAAVIVVGGSLTVQNSGPAFQGGETFQLFSAPVSGFTATNLPALTGSMYWTNNLALDGSIAVINPINTNPPPLLSSFDGTTLSLSWPTNAGWTLQMQTNSLTTGLGTNWVDVPGSSSITSTNITVNPALPTVFYRLKY